VLLQVAIDRVSVSEAERIINLCGGMADIVEVGTSLIKDFGLECSVGYLKKKFPGQTILADIKTIDEGEYEFRRAFEAGADIATVMGAASVTTISSCQKMAREYNRSCMIDLMGLDQKEVDALTVFDDAIFCLHLPSDCAGAPAAELAELIEKNVKPLGRVSRVAVAGGVRLGNIPFFRAAGIEIVIVGSAITKNSDIAGSAAEFRRALIV
jgi:3-hexulose-6-phosphate synthase